MRSLRLRCSGRSKSSSITINGRTVHVEGNGSSISVINGKVIVNGKTVDDVSGAKEPVTIKWDGPLANLEVHGNVTCGDVHGNVNAGRDASCGNVNGSLTAGRDVSCGATRGPITAGRDVSSRR